MRFEEKPQPETKMCVTLHAAEMSTNSTRYNSFDERLTRRVYFPASRVALPDVARGA